MNGNKAVLDGNILIFLSKGLFDPEILRSKYDEFFVSIITYMEVYGYEFPDEKEKEIIDAIFDNLSVIEISKEIADQAVIYRKNKIKKIKLPDAIILASAKHVSAELLTNNWRDFEKIDPTVTFKKLEDL